MPMCTVNAVATPAQTQDGRYRVPSTSEANIDLSGSSARNVSVNATAIAARYGMQLPSVAPQRPRIREASSAGHYSTAEGLVHHEPWPGGRAQQRAGMSASRRRTTPLPSQHTELSVSSVAASSQLRHANLGPGGWLGGCGRRAQLVDADERDSGQDERAAEELHRRRQLAQQQPREQERQQHPRPARERRGTGPQPAGRPAAP